MMYHRDAALHAKRSGSVGEQPLFISAKLVLQQLTTFYKKGNIPMIINCKACEKIVKLLDDNNKLRAIDKSRRDTPATQQKLKDMQQLLSPTFPRHSCHTAKAQGYAAAAITNVSKTLLPHSKSSRICSSCYHQRFSYGLLMQK